MVDDVVEEIPVLEKLTAAEIDEIFEEVGLPCLILDGCDWIPLKITPREQEEILAFHRKLLDDYAKGFGAEARRD